MYFGVESAKHLKQELRIIKIENYEIGQHRAPFIIDEMSGNQNQSLERALEIVEAGEHGLKIQTYTPDTMTLDLDHAYPVVEQSKTSGKAGGLKM